MNKIGADKVDQLPVDQFSRKNFSFICTMAVINLYTAFEERTNRKLKLKDFVRIVALKLAEMGGGLAELCP